MKVLSWDFGRSGIKGTHSKGNIYIPNSIGASREIDLEPDHVAPINNLNIEFDGQKCFIGNLAIKESHNPKSVFETNYCIPESRMFLLAMVSLLPDREFNLSVGLPLALYKTQKKDLARYLQGNFHYRANGESRMVTINHVSVFPQGVGAFWNKHLDYNGDLQCEFPERAGLVDIGYRDVNLVYIQDGEFIDKMSCSIPLGSFNAYLEAMKILPDYALDQITHDVVPQSCWHNLSNRIRSQMNQIWLRQNFPIYSSGGAAIYTNIGEILQDPINANANGYYKLEVLKNG